MKHVTSALEDALSGQRHLYLLTPHEVKIMDYVVQGHTNEQIALALSVSEGTIKGYLNSIRKKLRMRYRDRAALIAAYLATRET